MDNNNPQGIPQQRVADEVRIRLHGYAVTTWGPAPAPRLIKVGTENLIPVGNHTYKRRFLGVIGGQIPVWASIWENTYRVVPSDGKRPRGNAKMRKARRFNPKGSFANGYDPTRQPGYGRQPGDQIIPGYPGEIPISQFPPVFGP